MGKPTRTINLTLPDVRTILGGVETMPAPCSGASAGKTGLPLAKAPPETGLQAGRWSSAARVALPHCMASRSCKRCWPQKIASLRDDLGALHNLSTQVWWHKVNNTKQEIMIYIHCHGGTVHLRVRNPQIQRPLENSVPEMTFSI